MSRITLKYRIGAVILAMEYHTSDCELQHKGCWVLMNFSSNGSNMRKIQRKGGIKVIIAGMITHTKDREIQDIGCQTLGNLALSVVNERDIVSKRGLDAIITAMQKHSNDRGIQDTACKSLFNFAFGSKDGMINAGVVEAAREAWTLFDLESAKKLLRHLKR